MGLFSCLGKVQGIRTARSWQASGLPRGEERSDEPFERCRRQRGNPQLSARIIGQVRRRTCFFVAAGPHWGFEPQGLEHGPVPAHSRFHHVLTRYQIHLPTPYNCPVFLRLYALRTQLAERVPTSLGFVLDTPWPEWHSTSCTRRYLSWIEGLTTNQDVTGSNPVRRTTNSRSPFRGSFHTHWVCRPKAWPQAPLCLG